MGRIGVFDSGIGGLTVVKEIMKLLPQEQIVYFGDNANCPYGDKSKTEIGLLAAEAVGLLLGYQIDALVIACNTVTSVLIDELRKTIAVPVIGVIEGAAQSAVETTKNGKIGMIATRRTVESGAHRSLILNAKPSVRFVETCAAKLAPMIENGEMNSEKFKETLKDYLKSVSEEGCDTLILGCTHYPIVADQIQRIVGVGVALIDPAKRTAQALRDALAESVKREQTIGEPRHIFLTSADSLSFESKARSWIGISVEAVATKGAGADMHNKQ